MRPPPLSSLSFSAALREGGEGDVGRDLWGHLSPSAGEEGRRGQGAGTGFRNSIAYDPWSQILFPVWLQSLAGPGVELPFESRRQSDSV